MSRIGGDRPNFFPNPKANNSISKKRLSHKEINPGPGKKPAKNVSVQVSDKLRDFARIKDFAINSKDLKKADRIKSLKESIDKKEYKIDYDSLADIILRESQN